MTIGSTGMDGPCRDAQLRFTRTIIIDFFMQLAHLHVIEREIKMWKRVSNQR